MFTALTGPAAENAEVTIPMLSPEFQRELADVFKLLADQTRLRILFDLARDGELHVTALCQRLRQGQPAVSHHLALLKAAGLIDMRREGKFNFYSLNHSRFQRIMGELFCSLDDRDNVLQLDKFSLTKGV